jgi:transcriptional regulator with XRE-family HTH domain
MMDPDRFPLACLIRRERTSRAWSMERLAMAVNEAAARERTHRGSNRQTVCNWERGQVPHPDTLRWIAAALGVPVERLAEAKAVQVRLTRRQLLGPAARAGGALVLPARGGGRDHVSCALAAHCTERYVEAQRSTALRELGEPQRAVSLFESELEHWPSHYHRDRGFFLSQLALAYAANGDPEQAAAAGQEAVRIVRGTGCARTLSRLTDLDGRLAEHQTLPAVRELREALAATA